MEHKRVFIMAYARTNLGDDLFIVNLLKKYPQVQFYIGIKEPIYAKAFEKLDNANILLNNSENFENRHPEDYDGYIYVGGSIFMEGGSVYNLDDDCNEFMKECKRKNIPFFYISSNFGPYQTQEYFDLATDTFANCTDICFRDLYSYNLFKQIPSVRYKPDLIFSLQGEEIEKIKNSVGISIIDMSIRKNLMKYEKLYLKVMINNIVQYINQGKSVFLFSFCKEEGDERAIEKIKKSLPKEYNKNVETIYYDGNIEEYLRSYQSMEYMICCRFHSKVLSVAYKQKFFVLSYSDKIDNVIRDLELCEEYINIDKLEENTIIDLAKFKEVDTEKLKRIKNEAKKQLDKVEEWIVKQNISTS